MSFYGPSCNENGEQSRLRLVDDVSMRVLTDVAESLTMVERRQKMLEKRAAEIYWMLVAVIAALAVLVWMAVQR